jgi:hypothetical protein
MAGFQNTLIVKMWCVDSSNVQFKLSAVIIRVIVCLISVLGWE